MITLAKRKFDPTEDQQLYLDERTLWRLACEWNAQEPHIESGKAVDLTDDNPFVTAYLEVVRLLECEKKSR